MERLNVPTFSPYRITVPLAIVMLIYLGYANGTKTVKGKRRIRPPRARKLRLGLVAASCLVAVIFGGAVWLSQHNIPPEEPMIHPSGLPLSKSLPAVSTTAPTADSTVAGTVTVSASATNNVVGVQFKLDGMNLGAELTAAPYYLSWNTTTATNGAHALTAVARDAAGNVTTSSGVSLTVANLTLSILAPLNGATLTDLTKVKVQAASDIGLSSVLVFSDSTLIGTLSCASNPCLSLASTVDWTTTGLAAGTHYLYAVGTDTLGNTATAAVNVTVFNDTAPSSVSMTAPVAGFVHIL
jgi:hypothetical protein